VNISSTEIFPNGTKYADYKFRRKFILRRFFTVRLDIQCVKWNIRVPNFNTPVMEYGKCEKKSIYTLKENVTVTKLILATPTFARQRLTQNSYAEFLESQTEGFVADTK
jgi:hypothetical protein